jgi:hypothetical protein
MLASIVVTFVVLAALGHGLGRGRDRDLITHRAYNNRYSDAPAAREDHLG